MPSNRFSRRSFLSSTAAAAAAVASARLANALTGRPFPAPSTAPAATGPEKKLGFALVGIGSLSTGQLIPAFRSTKYCKLVAFVTGHRDKNMQLAQTNGISPEHVYTYDNFDTIKDNPDVDVIYIVLPNSMHCEYTVRAAKAGKHVLSEKPMATSVADCEKMIAACKDAKVKLMVAYRMQHEPLTMKLIDMCRDKDKIGKITKIDAQCGSDRTRKRYDAVWRIQKPLSGGGALMDMGVYALQSVRYLAGEEPNELTVTKYDPPEGGDGPFKDCEKNIVFDLKFPSGLTATVTSGYDKNTNRTQLTAEKGSLDLNPLMNYNGNKAYYTPAGGGARSEVTYTWANHFASEMDDFAQRIMAGKESKTPGEEGLRDMKIVYTAYDAAVKNLGKPVKLT